MSAEPTDTAWHPLTAAKRELRELRRNPPLDADSADAVLTALAAGRPITAIGDTPGLPAYWIINRWRHEHPEFDELCVAASEAGAESMLWETLKIADDTERAAACRDVSIRARQFAMKVLHRKRFDPATRVEVSQGVRDGDELTDAELAAIVRASDRARAVIAEEGGGSPAVRTGGHPRFSGGGGEAELPSETPPLEIPLKRVDNEHGPEEE